MKKMYSFRLSEETIENLDNLGNNRTETLEKLINKIAAIHTIATNGKFPSGIDAEKNLIKAAQQINELIIKI